jgi:hypothetical protein
MQTLVMVYNPANIGSWTEEQRIERWRRVGEWHQYAADLHRSGKISQAWGIHALTDAQFPNPRQHILIAVYDTVDFGEFDELREVDPLLDQSEYLTVPLIGLDRLREQDAQRLQDLKDRVLRDDPINNRVFAEHQAVIKTTPPKFVGQYQPAVPDNPRLDFDTRAGADAPLNVMLYGANPDNYVNTWDDMTKLLHCQKLMWWHEYMDMLIAQGHVTHAWGTSDYTSAVATLSKTGGNVAIYEARDYEEFDTLYRLDPVRSKNVYLSVVLRPIADQRDSDLERLELAKQRLTTTFA